MDFFPLSFQEPKNNPRLVVIVVFGNTLRSPPFLLHFLVRSVFRLHSVKEPLYISTHTPHQLGEPSRVKIQGNQ